MSRHTIKNRHGLKIITQVDEPENSRELVFIAHGQSGSMGQPHIQAFAEAFLENNFRVVRFDATNSLGESDGDLIDVTYDSYIEDLEDVINWAKTQDWFMQPFALCGHSMGAQSTTWYAEQHPDEILCLGAMAPTVNYELHIQHFDPEYIKQWEQKGYADLPSGSRPGVIKRLGWGVQESLKRYDILKNAQALKMPVLDVVGELDTACPPSDQQKFMDAIGGENKKLVLIKGVQHSYRTAEGDQDKKLNELRVIISSWLKEVTPD